MRRATMSGPPPGGIGTSRRIGRDGYCANAPWQKSAASSAAKRSRKRRRILACISKARPKLRVSCRLQHPERDHAPRLDQVKNRERESRNNGAANESKPAARSCWKRRRKTTGNVIDLDGLRTALVPLSERRLDLDDVRQAPRRWLRDGHHPQEE